MQTTSHLLMIRPVRFGFNPETAVNNRFQIAGQSDGAQENALAEFDQFAALLRSNGIDVEVVQDSPEPFTPDSIFPNNWVSFHADGVICLYPMFAPNRRMERKKAVLDQISSRFLVKQTFDLSPLEEKDMFLEGTGSMVLDRENRLAYACLSPRTHPEALDAFCNRMNYQPLVFHAVDAGGEAIYHSNVMMSVADQYAVVCLDAISDRKERQMLEKTIRGTGKEILAISLDQMNHFAGNMLQVENNAGEKILVMSEQAYQSLSSAQLRWLEKKNRLLHAPLNCIEANGGGSARCMLAEVFLPLKETRE